MPDGVIVLWWITLIVAVILILPTLLYLLHRTFKSANHIRLYTAETLAAAQGLAGNLRGVEELKRTPELADKLRAAAGSLATEAEELERRMGSKG